MRNRLIQLACLLILVPVMARGESIFANRGIGLGLTFGGIRSEAMGGTGIALTDSVYFNLENPACWYSFGKARYSISAIMRRSHARDDFGSDDNEELVFPGMALNAPIFRSFTLGIHYRSLSDYNFYNRTKKTWISDEEQGVEETYVERFQGEGGISRVGLNLASVFGNMAVGLSGDLLFGKLENLHIIDFDNPDYYRSGKTFRRNLSGMGIRAGLLGHITPGWSAAATVSLPVRLKVETLRKIEGGDSLDYEDSDFEIPLSFKVGFSYRHDRLLTAMDAGMAFWEEVETGWDTSTVYTNTVRAGIGLERLPLTGALDPWYQKWIYRAGISYEEQPFEIGDKKLSTVGFALGTGIPVKNSPGVLDLAFTFKYRGGVDTIGAREMIWSFQLGWSAAERWFVRRKR